MDQVSRIKCVYTPFRIWFQPQFSAVIKFALTYICSYTTSLYLLIQNSAFELKGSFMLPEDL